MKLSKLSTALLAGSLLMVGVAAQAEEAAGPFTTSGSVAMTTNYFYRGVTQSDSAALQGNIMISHESGLYFNVWGSSVASVPTAGIPASGLELDPSIGFAGKAGDVAYDVGVLRYGYPNSSAISGDAGPDFTEVYGSVAFSGAKLSLAYTDNFFLETGKMLYVNASYGAEVAGFGLSAALGYSKADEDEFGVSDYMDYKVAVSKSVLGLTAELAYIGNNLDEDEALGAYAESGQAVFTVSKAF